MSVSDTAEGVPEGGTESEAEKTRRDFMKATAAAAAAAGALGALGASGEAIATDSVAQDGVTIDFMSANAAENSQIQEHYQSSMGTFEEQQENVTVNLNAVSYGDVASQLTSAVEGGNPPDFAESGSLGIEFFFNDQVPDHGPFIEGSDGLPDEWTTANKQAADFRGTYWSGGAPRNTNSNLGIRPKTFSEVGVSDPFSELETWSQFYDVISTIDEEMDIIAYEETGVPGDLESYWGQARTAYTDGTDPWIRGDPTDPTVVIGNEDHEDRPRTDGMIKNTVRLANEFSSAESAQRGDEEIPSLMMTGRVASFTYALATASRWTSVSEDVQIGWNDGEGDFMLLPNPKLDPDYGSNVGISELEGLEGQHGGHVWALEQQHTIFSAASDATKEAAWTLNTFLQREPDFFLPAWGQFYEASPGTTPELNTLLEEMGDELPQNFAQSLQNQEEYGPQYANTGGPWNIIPTDQVRWTDINETISQAIAGQHSVEETPSIIRDRVTTSIEEQNE